MKPFTDIEQSKKLAGILPIESADMAWCNNSIKGINYTDKYSVNLCTVKEMKDAFDKALVGWDKYWKLIPCWSLAELISILMTNYARQTISITKGGWLNDDTVFSDNYFITYEDSEDNHFELHSEELIDVVIDMIVKLKEQKLL